MTIRRLFLAWTVAAFPALSGAQGVQLGPDPTLDWEGNMDYAATAVTLVPPGGDPINAEADPNLTQAFQDQRDAQTAQLLRLTCGIEICAVGMYSAGSDVTEALQAHADGGGTLNGEWTVGDVEISGGNAADPQTAAAAAASTCPSWTSARCARTTRSAVPALT